MTHNTREIEEGTHKILANMELLLIDKLDGGDIGDIWEKLKPTIEHILHQELQKAVQEEKLKHCCCLIEDSKVTERCKLHGDELQKTREGEQWRIWKKLAELADDGEDSFISAGDLNTHLDDVHKIIFTKEPTTVEEKTPLPEYAPWKDSFNALTIRKSSDQSELDQPTKLLNTIKKNWDEQAEELINGNK